MNQQVSFDGNLNKKKNKNDFYRFLLQQNLQAYQEGAADLDSLGIPVKVNNDILIPRSILKRNEVGPREVYKDQPQADELDEFEELVGGAEMQIAPQEGVVGRQLDLNGPILSPKTFNHNYLAN